MRTRPLAPTLLVLIVLAAAQAAAAADDTVAQRLFHIERNKNANIVAYDARVLPDGSLPEKDPVEVYWLKLAEDGARKNLKGIERRMAYGFKVRGQESRSLLLDMKADIDRNILVEAVDGTMRAHIRINGKRAILERIYIFAEEGGILPTVKYLELFGVDPETGKARYEKIEP